MLGKLEEIQIEALLKSQHIARIGCHADSVTYVVPVNYLYDGEYLYAHSGAGMKVEMMRKNPDVCIQVDAIQDIVNWQSVIVWGKFEEITGLEEKQDIMQKLSDKIMPLIRHENGHPSHGITQEASDVGDKTELVIYKIVIDKKTGRFEKNDPGHFVK